MSGRKSGRDKEGRSVVAGCVVFCIAAAIIGSLAIPSVAAEGTVNASVNAPAYVEEGEIFDVAIDVDSVINFYSGQFDLSFDSSVLSVTDVTDGSLGGETIQVDMWEFMDEDTIKVIPDVPGSAGVSGSGNLATIRFEVIGKRGESSVLDISNGMLVNTEAEEIPAVWIDDEVNVGPVEVEVNAPEMAKVGGTFVASIDVDSIADFNTGLFNFSFDSSVVNVTDVANGSVGGETIPVDKWERMDNDTIRVFLAVSGVTGVSGTGNLATISLEIVGLGGDRSVLDISGGMLGNTEAEEIPTKWIDDKVIVGPVEVEVNAPEMAKTGETFVASIDVDNIADFNSGLFDLSFKSSVVNVTDVANGSLGGETIPVDRWKRIDNGKIRVFLNVPDIAGVSGSGNLAEIRFEVVGLGGDTSELDISGGMLGNNGAEEIPMKSIKALFTVSPVTVEVNAPEMAKTGETFVASIDVNNVADFTAGLFDLSFDSSVVSVTDVADGSVEGETIPVDRWARMDNDTIRVFLDVSGIAGVSGSGNLATISFAVVGLGGDRSVLDISDGTLVNTEAEEITAEWMDDEVIVGPVKVEVNAPEMAKTGETFVASIDVDNIADFNSGLFDLSFKSSVVNVTEVADGCLDGATISVDMWDYMDKDTIRVFLNVSGITGVSGTGNLAEIRFEVVGKSGDTSMLDISNVMLANNKAEKIPTEWIDDLFTVSPVMVTVNAPANVNAGETFDATIDVDDIEDFNSGKFDISFNSSVVNATGAVAGSLSDTAEMWVMDKDTISVTLEVRGIGSKSGSGNLATINFRVVGEGGDKSALGISNGMLVNTDAEEIPAVWIPAEVTVGE